MLGKKHKFHLIFKVNKLYFTLFLMFVGSNRCNTISESTNAHDDTRIYYCTAVYKHVYRPVQAGTDRTCAVRSFRIVI